MLASTMVSNTGGKIADARQIMERLAARPRVRQVDSKNCDAALKDLHSVSPGYTNVGYSDLAGVVICSAVAQPGGRMVNYGTTPSFQTFLKARSFSVGEPFFGSITGKWIAILREPIWNARQEMIGGIHFPLDLTILDPHIPAQFLPAEVRYGFFTADGTLIWRNQDPERAIGSRPNSDMARRIVEVRDGEFESQGLDGVKRFYSVVSMPETGWLAYVGVPASTVFAEARQRAILATAIALATIIAMLLLALAIARRIAGPVAELERAARAVHAGDLGVRAAVGGPRDIAAVAHELNAMIEAQQHSDAKLRIAATAFESREGMLITDASHVILQVNRAFTDITGYTSEEVVGRTLRLLKSARHNAAIFAEMLAGIERIGSWLSTTS